jgi:Uri superfamily endonuclease
MELCTIPRALLARTHISSLPSYVLHSAIMDNLVPFHALSERFEEEMTKQLGHSFHASEDCGCRMMQNHSHLTFHVLSNGETPSHR